MVNVINDPNQINTRNIQMTGQESFFNPLYFRIVDSVAGWWHGISASIPSPLGFHVRYVLNWSGGLVGH